MQIKKPDVELRALLAVTRRLPTLPGMKILAVLLSRWYLRRQRETVETTVFGLTVRLNPHEAVERDLLFVPQLFDWREVAFLRRHLAPGDVFLDLGSNVGGYTMALRDVVGLTGAIVAVDADTYSANALQWTVSTNQLTQVHVVNVGLSDCEETMTFTPQTHGNRGGSGFYADRDDHSAPVSCITVRQLLSQCGIDQPPKAVKLDLEGLEFRVLAAFFRDMPPPVWPTILLVERSPTFLSRAGGDVNALIAEKGYRLMLSHGQNFIWRQAPVA